MGQPVPDRGLHLRSMYRDGWLVTTYEPGGVYDGTEGELYDLGRGPAPVEQPLGRSGRAPFRDDLVADLRDNLPPAHEPRLTVEAPV